MGFRKMIQDEARRQGLTAYRLARLSGVPQRTVYYYLGGERDTVGAKIEAMGKVLGLRFERGKKGR